MSVDRPRLKLLHTADVHIGDDYDPARRLKGFASVVDAAIANQVHALLIVGDLFDNARVKQPDITATLEQLARLTAPVIITSGNHDTIDPNSVYKRVPFSEVGQHIYFMDDPEGQHLDLPDLKLSIWCRSMVEHHPGNRPLAGYRRALNRHWRVVLAHGHFVPEDEQSDRSSPIQQAELAGLDAHYVALGHWHRFLDCTVGNVPAFYPGSPSEAGGTFASANLVTLDPKHGTKVERVPTLT
ncbi:MAG: DNA repair exonuclease [Chloroflexi bacterium]|nr:DNA repair exonuclease [Chloroflexota bacterium]